MKKLIVSAVALASLAGCTYYDYYKGGVKYTQDGKDCIYYADEYARHYSDNVRGIDTDSRIVYKNTKCADLFARDNAGRIERNDRKVLAPAATKVESCPFAKSAPVSDCECDMIPVTRRYYTFSVK